MTPEKFRVILPHPLTNWALVLRCLEVYDLCCNSIFCASSDLGLVYAES